MSDLSTVMFALIRHGHAETIQKRLRDCGYDVEVTPYSMAWDDDGRRIMLELDHGSVHRLRIRAESGQIVCEVERGLRLKTYTPVADVPKSMFILADLVGYKIDTVEGFA